MRRAYLYCLALAFSQANATFAQEEVPTPFVLGVQTHFSQGWKLDLLDPARALGAVALRDEISWARVEAVKGEYDFSEADRYMRPLIDRKFVPLIVINEVNPLYDGGKTPHSVQGRAGFAAYVSATLSHYGSDAVRIEIGNEVNTTDFVSGPALTDPPRYFAALVRAVDAQLAKDHPKAQFSCSGLNVIGIGFYRAFFRRGGLQACDAISVHPYRDHPDTLPGELMRLKALMLEFGGEKPIHVTEFGKWFKDVQDAPDYMLKMVTIMAANNIKEAYWYGLREEKWWPNMGLVNLSGKTRRPGAATFAFLQTRILPLGIPTRLGTDATQHIYRFGAGGFVLWGSGGQIEITGAATYYDSQGQKIDPVTTLSDSPVIVLGEALSVTQIAPNQIADSLYQYGQKPWSYYARRPDIGLVPLEIIDSNWTSTRAAPDLFPLQIGDSWITTARFGGDPYRAVERFTARKSGLHQITGWWQASDKTDTPYLRILHNGHKVLEVDTLADRFEMPDMNLMLNPGDTLDFEVAPQAPNGTGALQRRIRITGP